jgi:hypothetical protein
MPFDAHKNFAVSAVATAPSPAASGTSLVVTAGEGTRFPAVPFNAVVCPVNERPTPANAEVVRVTARSTDTLTITRAQEDSSARTIGVGDLIFAAITAKTLKDVEGAYAHVYHNANQSIANATLTILAFNSETEDTDSIHSTSTNTSRLTPPAGVYAVWVNLTFAANATGIRWVLLKKNGTDYWAQTLTPNAGSGVGASVSMTTVRRFNGTDYVEVEAYQDSGGALNVLTAGTYSPQFGLFKVGV